jgi:hypothetical protein
MKPYIIAALSIGIRIWAQQIGPTLKPQLEVPRSSATDSEMENWLNSPGDQAQRLINIGVDPKTANEFAGAEDKLQAKWTALRPTVQPRLSLLSIPCDLWTQIAHLYLLKQDKNRWSAEDSLQFDCHYDNNVSFEIGSIRNPKMDEIQVHHSCTGRGTGYLEQEYSVFDIKEGKFRLELRANELLRSHPTAIERPRDLDRKSMFTLIPVGESQVRAIEETQSSILNGNLRVQRRIFRWNPKSQKYIATRFAPVLDSQQ